MRPFNGVTIGLNDFGVLTMAVTAIIIVGLLSSLVAYLLFAVIAGLAGSIVGSVFVLGVAVGIGYIIHGCYGIISRIRRGITQ